MLALVLDTSSAAVTAGLVAVHDDGVELLAARVTQDARAHGELLAPSIRACLGEAGVVPRDLAAVVAGTGPGPFTGLRVGLVTAAATGDALGVPTYGVCSLDAIAEEAGTGSVLVVTDARRREVYWARYADGVRTAGPAVDRPDAVETAGVDAVAGAAADLHDWRLPARLPASPSPSALAARARERVTGSAPGEVLTPLYLRRPDAVPPGTQKPVTA